MRMRIAAGLLLASTSAMAAGSSVGYETGGSYYRFAALVQQYNGTGELFRIDGVCEAACTMFLAIRNVSDPQIKADGTLQQQAHMAAQIYKGFGRWSSVCSAIVCWASVVAL